jgi:phosphatidate cytidylyltransferase
MQNIFHPTNSKRLAFWYRLFSTVTLWTVALSIIFAGLEFGFFLLIGVIGMLALWEFYTMLDNKKLPNFKIIGMICGGTFICGSFYYFSRAGSMQSYDFEEVVLVLFMMVVFGRQMFERTRDISPLETMSFTLFGLLYVLCLFNFMTKIVYVVPHQPGHPTGHFYVLYLVVVTKFSDMGAYLTGSLAGRHPMVPHISPKKTWEGFYGALAFSLFGSYGMRAMMPHTLSLLSYWNCTVLGLMLGLAAIIGDLAESIIKRSCGVKDSGSMLPGIGGALDLIDSLLFTAPLLFFYMRLVMGVR